MILLVAEWYHRLTRTRRQTTYMQRREMVWGVLPGNVRAANSVAVFPYCRSSLSRKDTNNFDKNGEARGVNSDPEMRRASSFLTMSGL
jgi:hypothetical protein